LPLEMAIIELCNFDYKKIISVEKNLQIKKENAREIKSKQDKNTEITLQHIIDRWQDVIISSRESNHSIALALQTGYPICLDKNNLEIAFEHSFYSERFKEIKTRNLISDILKKVFNCDLIVKCSTMTADKKAEVKQKRDKQNLKSEQEINNLAEEFGGKVVD